MKKKKQQPCVLVIFSMVPYNTVLGITLDPKLSFWSILLYIYTFHAHSNTYSTATVQGYSKITSIFCQFRRYFTNYINFRW